MDALLFKPTTFHQGMKKVNSLIILQWQKENEKSNSNEKFTLPNPSVLLHF